MFVKLCDTLLEMFRAFSISCVSSYLERKWNAAPWGQGWTRAVHLVEQRSTFTCLHPAFPRCPHRVTCLHFSNDIHSLLI